MADLPKTPMDRKELFLSAAAGQTSVDDLPEPVDRKEQYLDYIARNGTGGGEGGTTNYNALTNKPQINGVTLTGDKSLEELGIENYDDSEIRDEISQLSDAQMAQGAKVETLEDEIIVTKTVSGSVVTVDDAAELPAESVVVQIEPQQDLHGYDRPWAGGNGKNLFDISAQSQVYNGIDFTIENGAITASGTSALAVTELTLGTVNLQEGIRYKINGNSYPSVYVRLQLKKQTTTTALLQVYDDLDIEFIPEDSGQYRLSLVITAMAGTINQTVYPMIRLATETDPTFEPYSNICPISGFDEVEVVNNGNIFDINDEYVEKVNARQYIYTTLKPNTNYTLSSNAADVSPAEVYFNGSSTVNNGVSINRSRTVRTGSSGTFLLYIRNVADSGSRNIVPLIENGTIWVKLEEGSSATPYHTPDIHTITLPSTVYGGGLDATEGEGENRWAEIASYNGETLSGRWISDRDEYTAGGTPTIGAQVVYELATPTTLTTTPEEIQMHKGTNIISANSGDIVELEYYPDNTIGEEIGKLDKRVTELENKQVEDEINEIKEEIKSTVDTINAEQADIKAYIGYTENDIYGVEVDVENRIFTRLAGAVGKNGGADFDGVNAFGGRRRCNLADDGTVIAYYGDDNFASDGSNGQVMVEQPKFYYKVVPLKAEPYRTQDGKIGYHNRKARYYISDTPKSGFKVHPAFIRDGKEVDYIYLSAFEASLYDISANAYITNDAQVADFNTDKLSSVANVKPMSGISQNLTRANTRKLAHNRGVGWEQAYAATISASQLLMLVEYASFNMQSAIGNGVVSKAGSAGNESEYTGATLSLGNASGNTGTYGSVSYRGEENIWGNIWGWVDGINIENPAPFNSDEYGSIYVADHNFTDNTGEAPYEDTNIYPCKITSGYINSFGYSEKFDWLFIPTEAGGNSALPVGDCFWNNNPGRKVARLGGAWDGSNRSGASALHLDNTYSTRDCGIGGRLVYVPIQEVAE